MRRVIMESPYAGDVEANVAYARACLRDCLVRGEAPIASHLLYTQPGVLDDDVPEERKLGIRAGLEWRALCDAGVFYIDRGWSRGMQESRDTYQREGIPIEERTLPGYVAPPATSEAVFTLRAWGEGVPHTHQLADELERIAPMVRTGFQAGDAMMDEDSVRGWWDQKGFDDD